ncbi:MAG: hypothetical protein JXA20_07445 [Spirochaetes bacterium]|nr:hypothetical protein [Spirochaetota bacterium]
MRTPSEYSALLEKRVLITEMIASVLYSLNKRVKNLKEQNPEVYRKAKDSWKRALSRGTVPNGRGGGGVISYYKKKDFILLSLFRPEKIHIIDGKEYYYYRVYRTEFHFPAYAYRGYGIAPPRGLERVEIHDFTIRGEETHRLLSVQFCDKVIDIIRSGRFILIDGGIASVPAGTRPLQKK